jgi:hypothetical protein
MPKWDGLTPFHGLREWIEAHFCKMGPILSNERSVKRSGRIPMEMMNARTLNMLKRTRVACGRIRFLRCVARRAAGS